MLYLYCIVLCLALVHYKYQIDNSPDTATFIRGHRLSSECQWKNLVQQSDVGCFYKYVRYFHILWTTFASHSFLFIHPLSVTTLICYNPPWSTTGYHTHTHTDTSMGHVTPTDMFLKGFWKCNYCWQKGIHAAEGQNTNEDMYVCMYICINMCLW